MSSNITDAAPGAVGVSRSHPAAGRLVIVNRDQALVREAAPDGSPRRKFAICGFAASSRMLAPFDDPAWSIWGLNQLYRHIPREDRHFDIHANWREDNVEGTDHPAWLARCEIPVYMGQLEPSIPTSVRYPLEDVIAGVTSIDYFTSTVAFMLALAIHEIDQQVEADVEELTRRAAGDDREPGVSNEDWRARGRVTLDVLDDGAGLSAERAQKLMLDGAAHRRWLAERYAAREIGVYGIDLVVGTEYDWQKACVEFVLGIAQARGITIRIPPQAALLKQQWRYGYEVEPQAWPIRLKELQKRGAALQNERNGLIARLQTIDGAIQECGYWNQIADLRSKGATVKLNEDT